LIAIWQDAVASGIEDVYPSMRLAELLEPTRPRDAANVLVAALRRGFSGPIGWLAVTYPRALREEDLAAIEARGDASSLAAAAMARASLDQPSLALPL